jgi:hypothetical protein
MASLSHVRESALKIVGPVCGYKARSLSEADVSRILHAHLLGAFGGVWPECPVKMGRISRKIDFRFGDWPHGANPCVVELAVRKSEGGPQLLGGQNRSELEKLSRYPATKAQTRVLLLLDLGHQPIAQSSLEPGYKAVTLGRGKFQRLSVQILYVHRELFYAFSWKASSK